MLLQDISQIDPLPRHPVRNHRDRDQEPNPVHGWNGKPEVIALEAHTLKSDRPSKRAWGEINADVLEADFGPASKSANKCRIRTAVTQAEAAIATSLHR